MVDCFDGICEKPRLIFILLGDSRRLHVFKCDRTISGDQPNDCLRTELPTKNCFEAGCFGVQLLKLIRFTVLLIYFRKKA